MTPTNASSILTLTISSLKYLQMGAHAILDSYGVVSWVAMRIVNPISTPHWFLHSKYYTTYASFTYTLANFYFFYLDWIDVI